MDEPRETGRTPRTILLATDLSARCDRALDRAVFLAERWQAELVILHVLEDVRYGDSDTVVPSWRRPPDPFAIAQRRLIEDVGPVAQTASLVIEEGDPADAIQRTVEARGCDLVITGVARDEPFGRFILGSTVDRLLRISTAPVLVVKNRARQAYRDIVVATDFSVASRHSLEMALACFPGEKLTIFHAYDPPMSGLVNDSAAYREQLRASLERDYQAFVDASPSAETIRQHARALIEFGRPDTLLRDYSGERRIDLVVLGTEGRSALFEIFVGSVAKEIMAELPCDALIVREPEPAAQTL